MIGIMNSPTKDSVDFYSAREENRVRKQESIEQTQAFTEIKRKPTVTYSPGGQRLIDGKMEHVIDGVDLWHKVIKKKVFSPKFDSNGTEETSDEYDFEYEDQIVEEIKKQPIEDMTSEAEVIRYVTTIMINVHEKHEREKELKKVL